LAYARTMPRKGHKISSHKQTKTINQGPYQHQADGHRRRRRRHRRHHHHHNEICGMQERSGRDITDDAVSFCGLSKHVILFPYWHTLDRE
jgi:hypothetical protein